MILFNNFVFSTLNAPVNNSQTSGIAVNSASAPYNNIPDPSSVSNGISYLILCDNPAAPTKFEILSYTGYTLAGPIFTLTGVSRGVGGTTGQAWLANAVVYQAPTTLTEEMLLWTVDTSTGNITYSGGNVDITDNLTVNGTATVDGLLSAEAGLTVTGTATATTLTATGAMNAASAAVSGNETIGGTLAVTGQASALQLVLGSLGQVLKNYRFGTWTPTLIGSSSAGTPVYTTQTGTYITIGKFVLLEFNIAVSSFTSSPSGDMIMSGYPSVGTLAGFAGQFNQFQGVDLFRLVETNIVGTSGAVAAVKQNAVHFNPITIAEATNQGIKFRITNHQNDQSQSSLQTQAVTTSRFLSASDFIYNGTSGETLVLSGSIMFECQNELLT